MIQITKNEQTIEYHDEFYSVVRDGEHWIRLTDGCFRQCWNCYTPRQYKVYVLPEIKANKVRFLDQNFLDAHHNPIGLIKSLPEKLNGKVIRYMFYGGLDFTFFTTPILEAMKKKRVGRFNKDGNFQNGLSIAWDRSYSEKEAVSNAVNMMQLAGYSMRNMQIRMLCNGKVNFQECFRKLQHLKVLRVQIDDCWYDNQRRGSVIPIYWTEQECKIFGKLCRAHNVAIIQNQYDSMDLLYKKNSKKEKIQNEKCWNNSI